MEKFKKDDYKLKRNKDNLVKLTQENVAKVEAMIEENSSYAMTLNGRQGVPPEQGFIDYLKSFIGNQTTSCSEENKKNENKFCGSTKWWVDKLNEGIDEEFKILIAGLIHNIDRTNSTHLNARTKDDKGETQGRKNIYNKIIIDCKVNNIDELKNILIDPDQPLIKTITKKDKKTKKYNLSFATKFCHYLSWFLFEEEDEKNMYAIYDSVVAKTLPRYIKSFGIENDIYKIINENEITINEDKIIEEITKFIKNPPFKKTGDDKEIHDFYEKYKKIIDCIIEEGHKQAEKEKKEEKKITRREFDHLVWYSNKGKIPESTKLENDIQL